MTRASGSPPPPESVELIPPPPARTVLRVIGVGGGLCAMAAVIGLADGGGPSALSTLRVVLCAVGVLTAGCGLTLRPSDWRGYVLAGVAGWLASVGLPEHWDSGRMLARVLGTVALAGGGLVAAPRAWRAGVLSAAVLFHFGALLTATTWPDTNGNPPPWVTNQAALRVYLSYFKFLYLGNAYHFYSPDPGPASHLYFLIQYETDEEEADPKTGKAAKKQVAEWVDVPQRRLNFRDPLGLSYYRRLSLTELVSYATPGVVSPPSVEKSVAIQRRRDNELGLNGKPIPGAISNTEIDLTQYRVPHSNTRRYMLPSYARHVAHEYSGPRTVGGKTVNYTVTRVKMFRVEHRVVTPGQFLQYDDPTATEFKRLNPTAFPDTVRKLGRVSPYHPVLYSPFYLGEFDTAGRLVNPDDPLLYWLIPIQPLPNPTTSEIGWKDWMSVYAGYDFAWQTKE